MERRSPRAWENPALMLLVVLVAVAAQEAWNYRALVLALCGHIATQLQTLVQ